VPLLLVAALVGVPLVEIYLMVKVGQTIGALPTVALLLALSVLGGYLLRREGRRAWRAFMTATQAGQVPAAEVADGALVLLGGALLLTPGFATDAVGLLCILPGSRGMLRRLLTALAIRRFGLVGATGAVAARRLRSRGRRPPASPGRVQPPSQAGRVLEGEVVDPDDRRAL